MIVAVPREIKDHEYRVALTPDGVKRIVQGGHRVLVEKDAGKGCGFPVAAYRDAGGEILDDRKRLFGEAELVVKVKEPQPDEYPLFRRGQTLFAFLHLAADRPLTQALQKRGVTAIAYETVGSAEEGLPLLKPMSEIAGRMSPLMGAYYLQMAYGGSGVLFPGASEAPPARVVILGAGTVGGNAAEVSLGMGGDVTLFYRGGDRTPRLSGVSPGRFSAIKMETGEIPRLVQGADLVIGAVLVKGAKAPKLVGKQDISGMKKGSVVVDVSIDQGGCFETSRPTTHSDPVYTVDGIIHYCVANMPGAYPRTATLALEKQVLPYVLELVDRGPMEACKKNPLLAAGLNVHGGAVTHQGVAEAHGMEYTPFPHEVIGGA